MQTQRQARAARLASEQRDWIRSQGGDLSGYIARYGRASDPDHLGEGGEAIYQADTDQLARYEAEAGEALREATTADHDMVQDVAHTLGLAITETSGSTVPILTHAPSTEILPDGTLRTTLLLPGDITVAESEAAAEVLHRLGGRRKAAAQRRGRHHLTVELDRDATDRARWQRAASRRIQPGGRA